MFMCVYFSIYVFVLLNVFQKAKKKKPTLLNFRERYQESDSLEKGEINIIFLILYISFVIYLLVHILLYFKR